MVRRLPLLLLIAGVNPVRVAHHLVLLLVASSSLVVVGGLFCCTLGVEERQVLVPLGGNVQEEDGAGPGTRLDPREPRAGADFALGHRGPLRVVPVAPNGVLDRYGVALLALEGA